MKLDSKIITTFRPSDLEIESDLEINNSIIGILDLSFLELNRYVKIQGCLIGDFRIHSCWFRNWLYFKNNVVTSYVDYQMGGHNNSPFIMESNVFNQFVNFFDCQFISKIELRKNVFIEGSNLFGNLEEGFHNTFEQDAIAEYNVGDLNFNGENIREF